MYDLRWYELNNCETKNLINLIQEQEEVIGFFN